MKYVDITVGNRTFNGWTEVEISHSIDAFSTLTLKAPMESSNNEFRSWFVPFSFVDMAAYVDGKLLFRGNMLGVEPDSQSDSKTVTVTGMAFPATMGDCSISHGDKPFEFNGITPEELIKQIAGKFGLIADIQADLGGPLERTKYEPTNSALSFLVDIVKERNAVLSNTYTGDLLCWKSVAPGNPVGFLHQQNIPSIRAKFSTQDYFSEVTGIGTRTRKHAKTGKEPEPPFTARNPFLGTRKRPLNIRVQNSNDEEPNAVEKATKARLARMFGNMAVYELSGIPSWNVPESKAVWERNTTVKVFAPNAMIYHAYEFLIRTVTLRQTAKSETADLELVMPGAFSGEAPTELPWISKSTGDVALLPGGIKVREAREPTNE